MALIINEFRIKITIQDDDPAGGAAQQGADSEVAGSDALVQACVDQVLQIIKENNER